ncbi:Concanavalin A-like lectin/glucanases superfamily protein [Catalinimonas alkaloidigena]|uniref:Concanavalin A-like lectin/glucanases superfamily protein n=1 Tax=Catalinimonas alkaloidigena TaxID=1075417 RepID=A0A1G9G8K5_9BACT|nr:LamG-like jellyroll fold domain-containing protein [Catalinimonas alkaloidigena]SDK96922.1 Concanavalin A-like lectin/glucanases superfamily protein [Catalinimonas alkaloidigena]
MNHLHWISTRLLAFALLAVVLVSCKKDDEPTAFTLSSLMAGDADLNAATSPSDVAPDADIVATFSTNVDPATVDSTNITLTRNYDNASVPLTITPSGSTITISPTEELGTGTQYALKLGAGLMSTDGLALTEVTRSFTTEGTFAPSGVVAHWTFEGNANDEMGSYNASDAVAITYTDSRNAAAGQAATFDGDASIIEVPNGDQLMNTEDFTLSMWVKTNSDGHVDASGNPAGHFVIGLGAFYGFQMEIPSSYGSIQLPVQYLYGDGTTGTGGNLSFNGEGKTKDNGGWQGTEVSKDLSGSGGVSSLVKDKWAHIVYTYTQAEKTRRLYINGQLMQQDNFNLWPDDAKERTVQGLKYGGSEPDVEPVLAFGFIQSRGGTLWDAEPWGGYDIPTSNHFKGQMDDVRIFHTPLTAQEIELMYNSEKP